VGRVRAFCMSLPGTAEKEAWGDPSFRANGRMYAILKFGRGTNLWLAAPPGAQESLTEDNPSRFFRPSNHPLHEGWVGVRLQAPAAIDWDEVEFLLTQAHGHIGARTATTRRAGSNA
ncbi:MAG: MmcQ/YjbR family DNA-binding protein, partial [Tepidiformaceae bacterium]